MNSKRHLQKSRSIWAFLDQFNSFWTLPYVLLNILAHFLYMIKIDFFFYLVKVCPMLISSHLYYKMAKMTPPLKSFLVVINKKWARILNRIHRRTQKALNSLKIPPTDLQFAHFFGLPNRFYPT